MTPVGLPHISVSSLLGYKKNEAAPGDLISWQHGGKGEAYIGRVIGRVDAPEMPPGRNHEGCPEIKGHICVLGVFCGPSMQLFERWIPPEDVIECQASSQAEWAQRRLSWLLSNEWVDLPVDIRRQAFAKSPWIQETQG
jgi:hypothetical protein